MDSTEYIARITILTGQPIVNDEYGRFVIDLETLIFHKDRFSIDFNHDDEIPIGVLENVHYERGIGLIGDAIFTAPNTNDKASEIIERLKANYPFEVSPTIELDFNSVYSLESGKVKEVNGYDVTGPVDIYYNVQFRGCGVVLFGTDPNTSVTALKQTNLITLKTKQTPITIKENDMSNNETEIKEPVEAPVDEATETKPEYLKLLDTMIENFGDEAGLRYFRAGMSMEDAEKADYAELKAMRAELAGCKKEELAEGADEEDKPNEEATDSTPETPAEDNTKEKEEMKAELTALKAELTKLRSAISSRGESAPVSTSPSKAPDNLDPIHKMANKIKASGIKKR